MGLLDPIMRLLGRGAKPTANEDAARVAKHSLAGRGTIQTQAEQDVTRKRMEDEMDAQRDKRNQAPSAGT